MLLEGKHYHFCAKKFFKKCFCSGLGDPYFYPEEMNELERRCSDQEFIAAIRQNITEQTHPISYYNPIFYNKNDHGTLHVSAVDVDRQIVSATSTINLFFGSKIKGTNLQKKDIGVYIKGTLTPPALKNKVK